MIGLTPAADAQMRDAGTLLEMTRPDYMHRDMVIFAQELSLDDGQRMILDNLYEDYRDSFESGWMGVQQVITESLQVEQEEIDRDRVLELVFRPLENWHNEKANLKERFEQDVRVILNAEQLAQWSAFERRITREKTMHYGRLSGESVDLIQIVRQLQVGREVERAIAGVLDAYSNAMNNALQARNRVLFERQENTLRLIRQEGTMGDQVAPMEREVRYRVAIREVNERYIDEIASSLPQEPGQLFRRIALERSFARAYRPLPAQRVFERAIQLESLEDDIRKSVEDMYTILLAELDVMNRQIHEATRQYEPQAMVHDAKIARAREQGESLDRLVDPTHRLARDRDERVEYYISLLKEMLTEEEFASIPGTQRWREPTRAESATQPPIRGRDAERAVGGQQPAGGRPRDGQRRGGGARSTPNDNRGSAPPATEPN